MSVNLRVLQNLFRERGRGVKISRLRVCWIDSIHNKRKQKCSILLYETLPNFDNRTVSQCFSCTKVLTIALVNNCKNTNFFWTDQILFVCAHARAWQDPCSWFRIEACGITAPGCLASLMSVVCRQCPPHIQCLFVDYWPAVLQLFFGVPWRTPKEHLKNSWRKDSVGIELP